MSFKNYTMVLAFPFFLLDAYLPAVALPNRPDPNPWNDIQTPTQFGHNEALGFYSAGCLNKASRFPKDGLGFHTMRLSRNRYWLHESLMNFLLYLGKEVKEKTNDDLLIGDIAQPRGGPFTNGHASHQIGLDVDIWFTQAKEAGINGIPTTAQRERNSAESMLNPRGHKYPLHPNPPGIPDLSSQKWTAAKIEILKAVSKHPDVERIFVHPYIKRALCQQFGGMALPDSDWLRKIRPWWGHEEHLHVRLKCPADSPDCRVQESTPIGDGCGEDLAWWFGPLAKEAWKKIQESDSTFKMPKLPERCAQLLK
jgi:penicillin-insensitive murein endopeptidase